MGPKKFWPAKGSCMKGICGNDAACHSDGDGTYTCICPHDSTQPTADLRCPNRATVSAKKLPPIPIVVKQSTANTTLIANSTSLTIEESNSGPDTLTITLFSVLGFVGIIILIVIILSLFKRCKKSKSLKESEANAPFTLTKSLLDSNKFLNNPQYLTLNTPVKTIPHEKVIFLEAIGEGFFGKVYKGELEDGGESAITVAIKVLKDSAEHEAQQNFMREVEIMSSFSHANILSLIGIAVKDPNKCPWMIFEFMPFGDLTEVLRSNLPLFRKIESSVPILDQDGLLSIALQIAHGMNYLATQHFVHRDLACRNCLVGDNLTVKIADFGMSRDVYTCDYYKIGGSRLLPVRWMSPESITYGRFTLESDVWSYGVVLWEVFSFGKQPYFGHHNKQVVEMILQGTRLDPPENCPIGVASLMKACWHQEPRDRINFPCIVDRLEKLASHQLPLPPSFAQLAPRLASVTSRPESNSPPTPSDLSLRGSTCSDLDSENYLKPNPPLPPHEYLQTISDTPPLELTQLAQSVAN